MRLDLALVTLTVAAYLGDARPSVTVTQGALAGSWMETRAGRKVVAFKGIPYAAPPVGTLRFKSPVEAPAWAGTRDAVSDAKQCLQNTLIFGIMGDEDCLFLNVYSPNISTEGADLPVIVFIHGGAFKSGSARSSWYGPQYLLDEDIVLVTVQYRLGIFGFLTLEDQVLPGNLGLKDQRTALRWIRENIAYFGGDPGRVTLFGESAGAASVHYHVLFNSDEGLFRAAILHSGSAMTAGSFQRPGDQRALVQHLLTHTGCPTTNTSATLHCLQNIRSDKLLKTTKLFFPPLHSLRRGIELSPVLEPDCVEDAFIKEYPWNRTTSIPIIIGTNKYEALFTLTDLIKDKTNSSFKKLDEEFEDIIPYNLMFKTSATDPASVARSLRECYLQGNPIDQEHILQFVNLLSDGIFNCGTTEAVRHNQNDTYLYSFNYHGPVSILNLFGEENKYGPAHVDELFLFFPLLRQLFSGHELDEITPISAQLIKIWTNFASNLKPSLEVSNFEWKPVTSSQLEYLSINGEGNFSMETDFYKERMDFWAALPFRDKLLPDPLKCRD